MRFSLAAISIAALAACGPSVAASGSLADVKEITAPADDTKVLAVLSYSSWCGSCKVLDPKVESVRASEDWTGVSFVLLDFTDKNEGALLKAADEAGIGPAIRRATLDGIRTGQLILMDIAAQEEMSRIGKGTSVKDMAERIRLARDEVS